MTMRDAPCGHLQLDESRVILDVNVEGARLLGHPPDTIKGQKFSAFLPSGSRIFFHTHVFPELAQRGRVDELYLSLLTADNVPLPVLLTACVTRQDERVVFDIVFMSIHRRTIFERELILAKKSSENARRAEQDALSRVQDIQEQLALQDRLASLGTLAAGVAHEINNPLAYAFGNLEVSLDALQGPRTSVEVLRQDLTPLITEALDGLERIRDIVRSLKSLSRVDDEQRTPIALRHILDAALRLAGHKLRTNAQVFLEVSEPSPVVEAHEGRLVQLVVNLLINAAQAMPERPTEKNRITVRAYISQGTARLDVEDNGAGIPAEIQPRIFDPFFTTKAIGVGTGLGLSVCHGIVSALGGTITVKSEVGAGTVFQISLPLSEQTPPPREVRTPSSPELKAVAAPSSPRRCRALIIDDEESVAKSLKRSLKDWDVTITHSGAEALALVEAGQDFDVVLCDLMMPGMTGIEVQAALLRLRPALAQRAIFMTGGASTAAAREFLARTPNGYLDKPFSVAELRALCEKVCGCRP